jgi:hypothetical protein
MAFTRSPRKSAMRHSSAHFVRLHLVTRLAHYMHVYAKEVCIMVSVVPGAWEIDKKQPSHGTLIQYDTANLISSIGVHQPSCRSVLLRMHPYNANCLYGILEPNQGPIRIISRYISRYALNINPLSTLTKPSLSLIGA